MHAFTKATSPPSYPTGSITYAWAENGSIFSGKGQAWVKSVKVLSRPFHDVMVIAEKIPSLLNRDNAQAQASECKSHVVEFSFKNLVYKRLVSR